jgi:hypothetical protein
MKLDQILAQHFYAQKKLSLQGIGVFTIDSDVVLPAENEKDVVLPKEAIQFVYNAKVEEDESLINFIVQQTRKIKPLASADLDSYLMLGRQFLNIGKPFKIEGIGTLEKNQRGDYTFVQGIYTHSKVDAQPTELREKLEEDISFASESATKPSGKKGLLITAAIVLVGLLGGTLWYFMNKNNTVDNTTVSNIPAIQPATNIIDTTKKDTTKNLVVVNDSLKPAVTNIATTSTNAGDGMGTFNIVIKEYTNYAMALKSFNRLTSYGHKLVLKTTDSVNYKLVMPIYKPLSDTTLVRDSVKKQLFGGSPYVLLN